MITPREIARQALSLLAAKADPRRAASAQRFFKERIDSFGLTSGQVREIAAALYQRVRAVWTVREAHELCRILLPDPHLEAKGVATLLLLRHKKELGEETFRNIKEWLLKDYCDNWASVDVLCPQAMGAILTAVPRLAREIGDWTRSQNRWLRRASVVSFINLARRGRFLEQAYATVLRLSRDEDDLVQKASGWLLREAGKTDMPRLERFLVEQGRRLPRTTLRYAIERFPVSKRQRLLRLTKEKGEPPPSMSKRKTLPLCDRPKRR